MIVFCLFVSFATVENRRPVRRTSPDMMSLQNDDNFPVLESEGDAKEKSILRSLGESVSVSFFSCTDLMVLSIKVSFTQRDSPSLFLRERRKTF